MAIFGKAVVLTPYEGQMFEYVLREGNNWDVFLNYFFAVLFIFCFVIGIVLNPFIIAYHAQQKRTFAKVLFLLVSSMDLFKSLYFPLVLVPKLLSPLGEEDYYLNEDLATVSWTAYANNFVMPLSMFEIDVLVILSIVRYSSVANPLSSKRVMNIILTAILTFDIMLNVVGGCLPFFYEPIVYDRVIDMLVCIDELFISNISLPLSYSLFAANVIFLLIGGVFTILTITYLKSADTASSEASKNNVRKGIISLVAMCLFNILAILFNIIHGITFYILASDSWSNPTTTSDASQFANLYLIHVIQSVFNAVSFCLICSSFKNFAINLSRRQAVNLDCSANRITSAT